MGFPRNQNHAFSIAYYYVAVPAAPSSPRTRLGDFRSPESWAHSQDARIIVVNPFKGLDNREGKMNL